MDMCYDGALVLPSSYAVMEQEEMTYTEGGKFYGVNLNKKQCSSVAYTLTVFIPPGIDIPFNGGNF